VNLPRWILEQCDLKIELPAWDLGQTADYFEFAIAREGGRDDMFDGQSMTRIHELGDGIPRKIETAVRSDLILGQNKQLYTIWPELMLLQTKYKSGEYTCGGDSGIPAWFEKNGEWIYIGASGAGMGAECSSAPDDPLWTDQFWSINSGNQFDTAQAYPEVIEAANKFLADQIIIEAKAAAELKAKQEAEAKAAAELKAKQEAEAKAEAARILANAKASTKNKKTTITCIKGKLTKKVTAVKPTCPKGYKKK
jgi:hypothetical protein